MPSPIYVLHNRWLPNIYLSFDALTTDMGSTPSRNTVHCHCVHVCSCNMSYDQYGYTHSTSPHLGAALTNAMYSESKSVQHAAIKDATYFATDGSTVSLVGARILDRFKEWGAVEEYRKIITAALTERLKLGWPYNYKAVDVLAVMPDAALIPFIDKLEKLSGLPADTRGSGDLKKIVKPILERAKKAKDAKVEEEAKKKLLAIEAAMGGYMNMYHQGLMASPYSSRYLEGFGDSCSPCGSCAGCIQPPSWPYNQMPASPSMYAVGWAGKPPDGWVSCVNPHRVSMLLYYPPADEDE
ncbi:hypothetical protein Q8F55_008677 [Vanrija albida]|uniref:Uncharacterized protein n=1 Tax=Vanrija albida TaxID=181172 RepID=A0ABR3PRH0_9TREE